MYDELRERILEITKDKSEISKENIKTLDNLVSKRYNKIKLYDLIGLIKELGYDMTLKLV